MKWLKLALPTRPTQPPASKRTTTLLKPQPMLMAVLKPTICAPTPLAVRTRSPSTTASSAMRETARFATPASTALTSIIETSAKIAKMNVKYALTEILVKAVITNSTLTTQRMNALLVPSNPTTSSSASPAMELTTQGSPPARPA